MFVGISERTNEAGAAALAKAFGASLPVIPVPVVSDGTVNTCISLHGHAISVCAAGLRCRSAAGLRKD